MGHGTRALLAVLAVMGATAVPHPASAADVTGRWRLSDPSGTRFDVVQTGPALTVVFQGLTFTGTVDAAGTFAATAPAITPGCPGYGLRGRFVTDDAMAGGMIGADFAGCAPFWSTLVAVRCGCDDGNTAGGDGCSPACEVEPCFACAGDPSVCLPIPDGGACEDGSACTTGETCSAGACGGGAPVAGCRDFTGTWQVETTPTFGPPFTSTEQWTQRLDTLLVGTPPTSVAAVDPLAGTIAFWSPIDDVFCIQAGALDTRSGVGNLDGTVTGSGVFLASSLVGCINAFPYTFVATRCGDGMLDPGEACDDGNRVAGDGCDDGCRVEPCFACSGTPSACSPVPDGSPCVLPPDACVASAACAAGACVATPVSCGPCEQCDSVAGCVVAPQPDCRDPLVAGASTLSLRDAPGTARDRLTWTWRKGPATPASELGDPTIADDYVLCVFDESGPAPSLVLGATAAAGGTCGAKPCWRRLGTETTRGYRYRDPERASHGLGGVLVKTGEAGKATAAAKAKGELLALGGTLPLASPVQLRVQLRNAAGTCWQARYLSDGVRKNAPDVFAGRSAPPDAPAVAVRSPGS
jgi:cysteine-rich repeat protein